MLDVGAVFYVVLDVGAVSYVDVVWCGGGGGGVVRGCVLMHNMYNI